MRPTAAALAVLLAGLASGSGAADPAPTTTATTSGRSAEQPAPRDASTGPLARATFAGGCFWCMEPPFDALDGVVSTTSGYTGGREEHPTYEQVSSGTTGHAEAVQVEFDPSRVSYERLLEVFWRNVDPTVHDRQFCDVGRQYRTAIFWHDDTQRRLAEASREALARTKPFPEPVVTEIVAAGPFWPAEDYHQDYARRNPIRYRFYRAGCGRDARLGALWGASPGH